MEGSSSCGTQPALRLALFFQLVLTYYHACYCNYTLVANIGAKPAQRLSSLSSTNLKLLNIVSGQVSASSLGYTGSDVASRRRVTFPYTDA